MQGSCKITVSCIKWLILNRKSLFLDINSKGCSGNTITWELQDFNGSNCKFSERLHSLIKDGLDFQVDYIQEPLSEGVHINILNRDKCGCGKSWS